MKIVLHIGEGKTGTTSIQRSLCADAKKLAKQGILYLPITGSPNQCWLNVPIGGAVRTDRELALNDVNNWFDEVEKQISSNKFRVLLLSAETLFNHSADDVICLLRERLSFDSLDVICYLRETGDYYLSLVQQVIKGGTIFPLPTTYSHKVSKNLKGWFDSVGGSSVALMNFHPSSWPDGSVVNSFSQVLSTRVGFDIKLSERPRVNETLSAEQMIALTEFRRIKLSNFEGKLHQASNALISLFNAVKREGITSGSKPILTDYARNQVVFRNSRYFQELVDLRPELSLDPAWENWFFQCSQHSLKCDSLNSEYYGEGVQVLYKILGEYSPNMIGLYLLIADLGQSFGGFNINSLKGTDNLEIFNDIRSLAEYGRFSEELKLLNN